MNWTSVVSREEEGLDAAVSYRTLPEEQRGLRYKTFSVTTTVPHEQQRQPPPRAQTAPEHIGNEARRARRQRTHTRSPPPPPAASGLPSPTLTPLAEHTSDYSEVLQYVASFTQTGFCVSQVHKVEQNVPITGTPRGTTNFKFAGGSFEECLHMIRHGVSSVYSSKGGSVLLPFVHGSESERIDIEEFTGMGLCLLLCEVPLPSISGSKSVKQGKKAKGRYTFAAVSHANAKLVVPRFLIRMVKEGPEALETKPAAHTVSTHTDIFDNETSALASSILSTTCHVHPTQPLVFFDSSSQNLLCRVCVEHAAHSLPFFEEDSVVAVHELTQEMQNRAQRGVEEVSNGVNDASTELARIARLRGDAEGRANYLAEAVKRKLDVLVEGLRRVAAVELAKVASWREEVTRTLNDCSRRINTYLADMKQQRDTLSSALHLFDQGLTKEETGTIAIATLTSRITDILDSLSHHAKKCSSAPPTEADVVSPLFSHEVFSSEGSIQICKVGGGGGGGGGNGSEASRKNRGVKDGREGVGKYARTVGRMSISQLKEGRGVKDG